MVKYIENKVAYYYDSHPTLEDLMGETPLHGDLIHYLLEVLRWLFEGQICTIYYNVNFYQTANTKEHPLVPDIAVIKGIAVDSGSLTSWRVGSSGPAPDVVLEIASRSTWETDLEEKPLKYAQMGVKEYFAYDPNEPPLPQSDDRGQHLFGWQLEQGVQKLPLDPDGRLWSTQLASFLGPDGKYLRLYDRYGNRRLTRGEAEANRADAEAQARQALTEKLRSLGIDPDQL